MKIYHQLSLAAQALLLSGASAQGGGTSDSSEWSWPGSADWSESDTSSGGGKIRDYYIAVEKVEWDYIPQNFNFVNGPTEGEELNIYVREDIFIGKTYIKSLYFEYTDDTFTVKKEQPVWLGNVGPIIRAEVGDTIRVHFKNNLPAEDGLFASLHPHGVKYAPEHEGAFWLYNQNAPGGSGSLPGGGTHTYIWEARESSGPTEASGADSNLWFYHGHVTSVVDQYSGQIAPLIVYKPGLLDHEGMPTDVDEEFVILFMVEDENQSHYLAENIETFGANTTLADFYESNLMHSMNGFLYGNLMGLDMTEGDRVRWHVAAYGGERDLHTAHWHGNNVIFEGKSVDTIMMMPATFFTAIMTPDAVGRWQFHCHINDHIMGGMQAFYTVFGANDDELLSYYFDYREDEGDDMDAPAIGAADAGEMGGDGMDAMNAASSPFSSGFFAAAAAAVVATLVLAL
eukprot:g12045.t1